MCLERNSSIVVVLSGVTNSGGAKLIYYNQLVPCKYVIVTLDDPAFPFYGFNICIIYIQTDVQKDTTQTITN